MTAQDLIDYIQKRMDTQGYNEIWIDENDNEMFECDTICVDRWWNNFKEKELSKLLNKEECEG